MAAEKRAERAQGAQERGRGYGGSPRERAMERTMEQGERERDRDGARRERRDEIAEDGRPSCRNASVERCSRTQRTHRERRERDTILFTGAHFYCITR